MDISYIFRRYRRSRHIRISLRHDGRVLVTAPMRVSRGVVDKFVSSQKAWIEEHIKTKKNERTHDIPVHITQMGYHACVSRAKKLIMQRLRHFNQHYGYAYKKISVRNQQTRWGSCSSKGNLNFRYTLLFLPIHLVDYVVVHELCHLKEMNHSKKFWLLVGETIPDYKTRRRELRAVQFGGRID